MRWRRWITVPGYLALCTATVAAAPFWLLSAGTIDLLRRPPAVAMRTGALLGFYLICEAVGMAMSFAVWLWAIVARPGRERWEDIHFRLEAWWGDTLFRGAGRLFRLRLHVVGSEEAELGRGPYLLLLRHASVGDALLPSTLVTRPYGVRLRYVLKRELLWDPCLDVVGQRVPNAFVDRLSDDSTAEIGRVKRLARDLGPRDGVLLCPEGTRFSETKRTRVLARLERAGDAELLDAARRLEAVLPPRLGGTSGLLDAAPEADVVFCVHTGLEGVASLAQLWKGGVVGRTVQVAFWRIPRAEVPEAGEARKSWLLAQWRRVNDWVVGNREEP